MGGIGGEPGGGAGKLLPLASYNWWDAHLAQEFFGPDQAFRPVLFFVDSQDPECGAVGGMQPAPLGVAVSARLDWRGDPYEPVSRLTARWKKGPRDQPPPCLPLLAATVFAAAQVRARDGAGAPAYYARLAEVLRPARELDGVHRSVLQKHRGTVQQLWHELDTWLFQQGGMRGVSTVHRVATTSFIKYAMSQAVIRMSDRSALADFFAGIANAPDMPGSLLLAELKRWNSPSRRLSQRFREALNSGKDDEVLAPLLEKLAVAPVAVGSTGRGLQQIRLLIRALEDPEDGWQLRWFAAAADAAHDTLSHRRGKLYVDAAEPDTDRYVLSGDIPGIAGALEHGFSAAGEFCEVQLPSRHLLVLAAREGEAGLFEAATVDADEPFRLLFDPRGQAAARRFFSDVGERWSQPEETSEPGWYLTDEIDPPDASLFADALSTAGLNLPRTRGARRVQLRGGLRAKAASSAMRHGYLLGGEPDACFVDAGHGTGEAMLCKEADGSRRPIPVQGARLPLRGLGLTAGSYRLEFEGQSVGFSLNPLRGIPSVSTHMPKPDSSGSGRRVCVPLAGDVRFLDVHGRFHSARRPRPPRWWSARNTGLGQAARYFVDAPADAVWLVVTLPGGEPAITLLEEREPEIGAVTQAARKFWTRLILCSPQDPKRKPLWTRYRQSFLSHAAETDFRGV
ncbi:hypothetical protein [Actinoallomurus iriomotensis]|uniref:Uncharacterized protein n=1 Tax=Actinoallomurus iriomotensis TaxID=478107 RepID=A0A9W6S3B3_9ACTN|nr:hypothetical protein [Actinoallomurus iriomotensis]GLY86461.1 hypothetical protein Airi02_043900 [Actinoallomurus iriomotensis]